MTQRLKIKGNLSKDRKTIILEKPLKELHAGLIDLVVLQDDADISDDEWLAALSKSNLYDDLKHTEEDIYSLNDGKPHYGTR